MTENKGDGVNRGPVVTRRGAIRLGLGALAVGVGLGALDRATMTETVLTQVPAATPAPTEIPLPEPASVETSKPLVSETGMVFAKGYDEKDTQEFAAQVIKEKENIQKNRYEGVSMDPDKTRVNALRGQIDASVAALTPAVAPFIPQILPGLIFVESRGDPGVEKKENKAIGLCQITPIVLTDLEKAYPGFTKGKDLKNPADNIAIAAKYLDHLYKIFPDPALATWAFHIGQTRLSRAMYRYLVYEKKVLTEHEYDKFPPPQTAGLVQRFRREFSVPKFMDAVPLAMEINEQYSDEGLRAGALRYVPLVSAGNELLAA